MSITPFHSIEPLDPDAHKSRPVGKQEPMDGPMMPDDVLGY